MIEGKSLLRLMPSKGANSFSRRWVVAVAEESIDAAAL